MKKLLLLLAAVGMIFTACQSGGDVEEDNGGTPFVPEITISPKDLTFGCNGGEQAVDITANFEYEFAERASWLTVEQTDEGLLVVVDANKNTSERSAFISITNSQYDINKSIEVWQEGYVPKIELAQQSIEVEFEPAEYEVAVTSPYSWEATTKNDWIVIESKNGIAGEEVLIFSTKRNEEEKVRKGTITVYNSTYNLSAELYITQKAFVPAITIDPETMTFSVGGGTQEIAITANFEYTYNENSDWLTIEKSEKGIKVTAKANTNFEERTTEITISRDKYGISETISVTQKGISAESQNVIIYTSSDGKVVRPYKSNVFGANIVSNTYSNGQGVIIFDAPVTSIGGWAFSGCSRLTSVTIPDSVTSIGDDAFYKCTSLKAFYGKFASADNRCLIIEGVLNSFAPAGSTEYTIPDSVTSIGSEAFAYCTSLTGITIPDSVTSIGASAFSWCTSLTSVHISDLSAWCKIDFSSDQANPLCYAEKLYLNGTEVTELTIPSDITTIKQYAFYYCSSLTSVTIPDSVTSIGNSAFRYCSSLTSVTIPDRVTLIGDDAFYGCTSLTSVTIGNSVTSIGEYAFSGCTGELIINSKKLVETNYTNSNRPMNSSNGWLYGSKFTKLTIGNSVTSIGWSAFDGCSSLTSVKIPDSVTSIGYDAFYYCSSLTSITIPDSVTSIGSSAFRGCTSLTSVTIPDSVTSIGWSAFDGCTGELTVNCNIPSGSPDNYGAFYGSKFTKVTIGDSVTSIGSYAFSYCSSLTSVTIPDSVTSIENWAFGYCGSLTSITIPDSVTSIGSYAFYNCSSLTSVYCNPTTPPAGGYDMFDGNASGRKIYVPRNSISAYKSAEYWSVYKSYIEGYDF